ncbi:MAG TPA: hypothetical protein VII63_03930 [Caulobacteraceae bacterium]
MNDFFKTTVASSERREGAPWRSLTAVLAMAAMALAAPVASASAAGSSAQAASGGSGAARGWKPMYVTIPHAPLDIDMLSRQANAGTTIPFWTTTVTSPLDGNTYRTSMVGSSPYAPTKRNTSIVYVPIVARIHFANGVVLDANKSGNCDPQRVSTRFFNSPLFQPTTFISNGVDTSVGATGGTQFVSAFQRANFWNSVGGTNYGITLTTTAAPIVVDVTAPATGQTLSLTATCRTGNKTVNLGMMDINDYDAIVNNLVATYATPTQLPIILTYNFVMFIGNSNNCCVLGYHNAVPLGTATQTYAVGSVIDPGIFTGVEDMSVWTHEIGEWLDDPFVQASVKGGHADDVTPAWGHTGQVSGCQNNLEVGDPLSGISFPVAGVAGYHYHYQDLAFQDWFYRTPSQATGGRYSMHGTFRTVQGACS